jgi:hypothetical protein
MIPPARALQRLQWVITPKSGHVRIPVEEPCELEIGGGRYRGKIWNLSTVGVYVVVEPPLPAVGQRVRVAFQLAVDSPRVVCEASVAWQNPPSAIFRGLGAAAIGLPTGCGLTFLSLVDGDRQRIAARISADPRSRPPTLASDGTA